MSTPYQDIWIKGEQVQRGQRECANRYEIVRSFFSQYQRPFTVLDMGASDGYFAVRLVEDFPDCTVVAVEPRPRIGEILHRNDAQRVLWLRKKLSPTELSKLADVEHFDVTLALSVIHWMKRPPAESIEALRRMGDHLILELPVEAQATGQEVVQKIEPPKDGTLLGYGASHLDADAQRPITVLSQEKTCLERGYWDSNRPSLAHIVSDFQSKTFHKGKKVSYPWLRGINLQTFLRLGGTWPRRARIADCVREAYLRLNGPHGDIAPWNVILQGDRAVFIDSKAGSERAGQDFAFLNRLLVQIVESEV